MRTQQSTPFSAWLDKGHLAIALVLLALLSLTSVYRPRPVTGAEHHAVKTTASPAHQRTLKASSFEVAVPTTIFVPLLAPTYVRPPVHADRTLSPRRLPGSYFNRPPPALLS